MKDHSPARVRLLCSLLLAVTGSVCTSVSVRADVSALDFNRDIRPILSDNCFQCHGPDRAARKADLRLDIREEAVRERRGARPIVPGDPDASELVFRVFSDAEYDVMPPPESKLSLTEKDKHLLRQWVAEGAEYQAHWSFTPLPDSVEPPEVKNTNWPRNDLDRFILARLEAEGLPPAREAPRHRWLRRATFDLTGLPPTQEELDTFLLDTTPQAYEKVVDRLLASPRFGERMAMQWLDAARYADSYGYQADLDTHAWPYRDWVIEAFNRNLPYDQFITYQLAGDMLPDATRFQKLATAFLRVGRKTQEGGSIEEEFRQDGISDRIHTVGTAMMGLTMECARCHDHKFDPISMKEYYQLGAFFNSIDEWGLLHGNRAVQPHPVLYLTTPEQDDTLAKQRDAIAEALSAIIDLVTRREPEFQQWLAGPHERWPVPVDLEGMYDFEHAKSGKLRNAANPLVPGTAAPANEFVAGRSGQGIRFTGDDAVKLTHANCRHMHDPVSVAFWIRPAEVYPRAVVFHNTAGNDPGYNGYELLVDKGRLRWMFVREWPGNCIAVRTRDTLPVNEWTHVAVTYDGSSRAAGLRIYLNGRAAEVETLRDKLVKDSMDAGNISFGERFRDNGLPGGVVDEVFTYSRAITTIEIRQLVDGTSLHDALARKQHTDDEVIRLRDYYFSAIDSEARSARAKVREARVAYRVTMDQVQEVPVMKELPEPRPAYILARGAYDAPTERVSRETPEVLPPYPSDAPRDRLGFARWLTHPNHPLTARVAVNRAWQLFFERGLVATTENFGLQGESPSHPALLDWLARDFIAHDWDYHHLCRRIVLSATYRQDSRTTPAVREQDPENVLLARGPAKRLTAEMLRDNALVLSGLLVPEIGGPPVLPYQPEGSMWRDLNNFLPEYKRDTGDGLYRRSMYTFWRRTTPPPNMIIFDAATREVCSVREQLTLTPLQPLVLMNDPQFFEAARALGERMLREGGETPEQFTAWAFREVTGHSPTADEHDELTKLYATQLAYFEEDAARCEKLLGVGDYKHKPGLRGEQLAAAAMTASTLLNLDATVMLR